MSELGRRLCLVNVKTAARRSCPPPEIEWTTEACRTANSITVSSTDDGLLFQHSTTAPWNIAFRDPEESGKRFVPAEQEGCIDFWDAVVLKDHP